MNVIELPRREPDIRDVERRLACHNASRLKDAAASKNLEVVREILNSRADPNYVDQEGKLPLHAAVLTNAVQITKELLSCSADANSAERASEGSRPLTLAAWQGHSDIAKLLLLASADVDMADGRGWTPLCGAARQGHVALVNLLLDNGADAEQHAQVQRDGRQVRHSPLDAAREGRVSEEVVRVLKNRPRRTRKDGEGSCFAGISCCLAYCGCGPGPEKKIVAGHAHNL